MRLCLQYVCVFLFVLHNAHAQTHSAYERADKIAFENSNATFSSIDSLAIALTKNLVGEKDKARSIFTWVANNIAYDVAKYESQKKLLNMLSQKRDSSQSPLFVLKQRKAVCEGYSNLVKALCEKAGLAGEVIEGIGRPVKSAAELHGWNAVKIDSTWILMDVTWAAGGIDPSKNIFRKHFDDSYFMVSPAVFIKTHYPFDPMWQLLTDPVTRKEFENPKGSGLNTVFNFNDSINLYFAQDSISQLIGETRRTLAYDPDNNLAEMNLNNFINYHENEKMNTANNFLNEAVQQFNECVSITNEAKKNRSTKRMNANETKLRQLVKDSKANIEKGLEMYKTVHFTGGGNEQILKQNISNSEMNLKQITDFEKYLDNYYNTPKAFRMSVL